MVKYKKQVQAMLDTYRDIFESFKKVHDAYSQEPDKWQKQFNKEGQEVLHIIQRWENSLCSKSESGKYGKFSTNLSEKFWSEIRTIFPKIDYIGMG